ncbi:MAG TPA: hypothetical protein VGJ55_20470, partial [Pyrinomonadaceae bacterium]
CILRFVTEDLWKFIPESQWTLRLDSANHASRAQELMWQRCSVDLPQAIKSKTFRKIISSRVIKSWRALAYATHVAEHLPPAVKSA